MKRKRQMIAVLRSPGEVCLVVMIETKGGSYGWVVSPRPIKAEERVFIILRRGRESVLMQRTFHLSLARSLSSGGTHLKVIQLRTLSLLGMASEAGKQNCYYCRYLFQTRVE